MCLWIACIENKAEYDCTEQINSSPFLLNIRPLCKIFRTLGWAIKGLLFDIKCQEKTKKNLHINCLADPSYFLKYYVEIDFIKKFSMIFKSK